MSCTETQDMDYKQKRARQLFSKMRFLSCQFLAYLEDDLWLKNAAHANNMAQNLAKIFAKHNLQLEYSVEANELFARIPTQLAEYLHKNNGNFYQWEAPNDLGYGLYRFVTSFATTQKDLDILDSCLLRS